MKRRHLFEFSDQAWLPGLFRQSLTEILAFQAQLIYRFALPKLTVALRRSHATHILDLCSGSGGPWTMIAAFLKKNLPDPVRITLTDKFPIQQDAESLSANLPHFYPEAVDARSVPANLQGFRTLFTGFHHFKPADAKQILQDAVDKKQAIAVFEFTERKRDRLQQMWSSPRMIWQLSKHLPEMSRARKFWTYIIPVIPLIYLWDGWVSHWRTYTVGELGQMTADLAPNPYVWDIGQIDIKGTDNKITYLIGYQNRYQNHSQNHFQPIDNSH